MVVCDTRVTEHMTSCQVNLELFIRATYKSSLWITGIGTNCLTGSKYSHYGKM